MSKYSNCINLPSACSIGMEWRTCDRYALHYVSEYGDVVLIKHNRRLRGFIDYDGYPSYKITCADGVQRQVSAHRLVATCFHGEPDGVKTQVRHLNGSKLCAHYSNLKWGTARENRDDTVAHGTSPTRGERNPTAKLTSDDVIAIREAHREIKEGRSSESVSGLANRYGVHIATICGIASRASWKHIP